MYRPLPLLAIFLLLALQPGGAQDTPFSRGVNLTNWFQAGSARQIQFSRYDRADLAQIKSLGADAIRLPINLHAMTSGAPDYRVDPLLFTFLDQVVDWAEALELHLILDNHSFDPSDATSPQVGTILRAVWRQVAQRYRDRSDRIYYEILNEPHGISHALWGQIQGEVITAIRAVDTRHTIIVGGADFNSYRSLASLPVYSDRNLIYTFHFYDPFLFTHQGASWVTPSMVPLAGMPFPYRADRMPTLPAALRGSWIESAYNAYATEGTEARVRQLIDIAVRFRDERKVPIFCGEFGVYQPNSDPGQRVYWYEFVRKYLEEKKIDWTIWDYHGGFGLFRPGGSDLFAHDLNVPLLEALGFSVPPQTPFVLRPDTVGSLVYSDYIGPAIVEASYTDGDLDFYATDQPDVGRHCIRWTAPGQYQAVGFDFRPNRDLSDLVRQGFALDLLVRRDRPGPPIDIRFIDTKTGPTDRPWRMRTTLDLQQVPADGRWHHLYLPLSDFREQGAWDQGWYNPEGKFDWAAIDRLEIVAEHGALPGTRLWFDQIQLTDRDTTTVRDTSVYGTVTAAGELATERSAILFPNPVIDQLHLRTDATSTPLNFTIYDARGLAVRSGTFREAMQVDCADLPAGSYWLRLTDSWQRHSLHRFVKL